MKNYKKGVLILSILSAMSLIAAEDKTIYVNTFADEDGENPEKCSLREAVTAASLHQAYGGCPAGQPKPTMTNIIQLEEGEYKLKKELQPNAAISIVGKLPADYSKANILTNSYPALTANKTIINAESNSRIFNTSQLNKPGLSLNNITLKNGYSSTEGGTIYAGGSINLSNVSILNSKAKVGGAIFLNDINSSVTIGGGTFQGNDAAQGSFLAMTCNDNLIYTTRSITLSGASVVQNGSPTSLSTFAFCGQPGVNISTSTIAKNIADSSTGRIIQFTSNTPQGKVNMSISSVLQMLSNTIVQNTAASTLLYNSYGSKVLSNNILAFNGPGKSCRYADGDVTDMKLTGITAQRNALSLAAGADQCELSKDVLEDEKKSIIDMSGVQFSTVLSELQPAADYTAFVPMYFPKDTGTDKDVVDTGSTTCSNVDQRGVSRIAAINSTGSEQVANNCDYGSTEVLRLTAHNLSAVNTSVTDIINAYQKQYDIFKGLVENKETKAEFLPYYTMQMNRYNDLVNNTKSAQKYRTIFVDPFTANLPDEYVRPDGGREIRHLTTDNYDVTVKKLGTGKLDGNKFVGKDDPGLFCEWDPKLKQILVYRTDDFVTPTGDYEFCSYTLKRKNSNSVSDAYIITNFTNIAPVAKDASFNVQHGTLQKIDIDLLGNMNDDGDGLVSALKNKPNKTKYYVDSKGQDLAIRFDNLPDPIGIVAERSGPCPGNDRKQTCYGGKISVQLKNTLDPFDYKFKYSVYDADEQVSNAATVTLKNSASTPDARSGGGALGWFTVFGLAGLLGLRRVQQRKHKL